VIALIAFAMGALLATGAAALLQGITDGSRPWITLADVVSDVLPGFTKASTPSHDACGNRRWCVEGVVGDGVAIYRYGSLDLARQSVIYSDADFYRSDRFVIEFEDSFTAEERFQLLQVVEGAWTGSSD
jgi:hypothetical protein